jgi:heme exporter protein D
MTFNVDFTNPLWILLPVVLVILFLVLAIRRDFYNCERADKKPLATFVIPLIIFGILTIVLMVVSIVGMHKKELEEIRIKQEEEDRFVQEKNQKLEEARRRLQQSIRKTQLALPVEWKFLLRRLQREENEWGISVLQDFLAQNKNLPAVSQDGYNYLVACIAKEDLDMDIAKSLLLPYLEK